MIDLLAVGKTVVATLGGRELVKHLRVATWGGLLLAGCAGAITWPSNGVALLAGGMFWWAAECTLANWRQFLAGRSAASGSQSSATQNRLLILLLAISTLTVVLAIFAGSGKVLASAAACSILFVFANTEATPETKRAVAKTLFARAILKLRFPRQFISSTNGEFSAVAIIAPAALLLAAVGLAVPQVSGAPGTMLHIAIRHANSILGAPSQRDSKHTPKARTVARNVPEPASVSPCDDAETRRTLSVDGVAPAVQSNLLRAQHQYGPPSVGCLVSKVGPMPGGRTFVVFSGGKSSELVIGNARAAAATVNAGAQALVQRVLDPTQVPQVMKTFTSTRAATGVFQLVEMSDGSCRMLLSPDGTDQASLLTPYQTTRVATRGQTLIAFPMATADAGTYGTVIEYIAVDPSSPNGYRRVLRQIVPFGLGRQAQNTQKSVGCSKLNDRLFALADPVEAAAEAAASH